MRQYILTLILVVFIPFSAHATPELKGSPTDLSAYLSSLPKEVMLIGEARLEIQAESGVVTLGIKSENSQLQKALQKNQQLRNEISTKLINSGIAKERIIGTRFSSTPEYGFFGKKPNNYIVENVLKITVSSETELQKVAEIVDSYQDVYYQGIELKEQKKEEIKRRLLDMALADAKQRQKEYETGLNIILTPISFEENIFVNAPPFKRPRIYKDKLISSSPSSENSAGNDLSLGEHVYQGNVRIRYHVTSNAK